MTDRAWLRVELRELRRVQCTDVYKSLPRTEVRIPSMGFGRSTKTLTVPVILHETSTRSVQIISSRADAAGTLRDLKTAISSVLGSNDVITSLTYRASQVDLRSSLDSFTSGGSDGPLFQATCSKLLGVIVADPSGQQLHHLFRYSADFSRATLQQTPPWVQAATHVKLLPAVTYL